MKTLLRIKQYVIVIITFSAFSFCRAQDHQAILERLKSDIGALSHDSMQGRGSGTANELKAARFIESTFRSMGLMPFNEGDESFLAPFSYGYYHYGKPELEIGGMRYEPGVDFGAIAASSDGQISGELIIPAYLPGIHGQTADLRKKVAMLNLKGLRLRSSNQEPGVIKAIEEIINSGASAILLHHAEDQLFSQQLFHPDSLPAFSVPILYISRILADQLSEKAGDTCILNVKIDRKRSQSNNVIGYLDNKSDKTVIIGGHYDHVGITGKRGLNTGEKFIHNGADDNASGTAVVMELARWLVQQEGLKYNYLFIAFGAEELGLYGSRNFCNGEGLLKHDISYMLNLDMVGRLGWKGRNVLTVLGLGSSKSWKSVTRKLDTRNMKLRQLKGAPGFSDHHPFVKHGVPVIYFTTGLHKDYHTPLDDPERINYQGAAEIVEVLQQLISGMDKSEVPKFSPISGWQNITAGLRVFIFR